MNHMELVKCAEETKDNDPTKMRVYEKLEDMHKVSKNQWRQYFAGKMDPQIVEKWTDEELFKAASGLIADCDEGDKRLV